jgi:hypothetical protein
MKRVILVALASLFVASSALAVVLPDDGTDSFGVYFENDDGDMVNTKFFESGLTDMYLAIAGVSAPTVAAWEVALDFDPALGLITGAGIVGDGVNFATLPMFIVGLGTPMPPDADGNFVLAVPTFFLMVPDAVVDFFAGPVTPASIEGVPAYVNGENLNEIIPMTFSVDIDGMYVDEDGWTTVPIATVNGEGGVATESTTWGSVKSMYR